jgi:hypothetical protein
MLKDRELISEPTNKDTLDDTTHEGKKLMFSTIKELCVEMGNTSFYDMTKEKWDSFIVLTMKAFKYKSVKFAYHKHIANNDFAIATIDENGVCLLTDWMSLAQAEAMRDTDLMHDKERYMIHRSCRKALKQE